MPPREAGSGRRAPSPAPEPGWCAREVEQELPGLRLLSADDGGGAPRARSPVPRPATSWRACATLSNRFRGAAAVAIRREPVPSAYRVFFRHIGLDPEVVRTPIEAAVLERMLQRRLPLRRPARGRAADRAAGHRRAGVGAGRRSASRGRSGSASSERGRAARSLGGRSVAAGGPARGGRCLGRAGGPVRRARARARATARTSARLALFAVQVRGRARRCTPRRLCGAAVRRSDSPEGALRASAASVASPARAVGRIYASDATEEESAYEPGRAANRSNVALQRSAGERACRAALRCECRSRKARARAVERRRRGFPAHRADRRRAPVASAGPRLLSLEQLERTARPAGRARAGAAPARRGRACRARAPGA